MNSIALTKNFVWQSLSKKEVVVYSPNGSAQPFILSGTALSVFQALYKSQDLSEFPPQTLEKILNHFASEGLLNGSSVKSTEVQLPCNCKAKNREVGFWIHTTNKCNLRCIYCYVPKGRWTLSEEVMDKLFAAILLDHKLHDLDVVDFKFAGGEPLLALRSIKAMVAKAKVVLEPEGIKLNWSIITNGTLINSAIARYLKEQRFSAMVSLDGIEEFNQARIYADGRKSWQEVIHGVDILLEEGIKPTILTVVSNHNVGGLNSLMRFVRQRNLSVSFSFSRDYGATSGQLILDTDGVVEKFLPALKNYLLRASPEDTHLSFNGISFEGKRRRVCGACANYFAIGPMGSVSSCQMTVDTPLTADIPPNGILDLSQQRVCHELATTCSNCVWKHVCCQGCEVLAEQANTWDKPHLFCSLFKELLPVLLLQEGRTIVAQKKAATKSQ